MLYLVTTLWLQKAGLAERFWFKRLGEQPAEAARLLGVQVLANEFNIEAVLRGNSCNLGAITERIHSASEQAPALIVAGAAIKVKDLGSCGRGKGCHGGSCVYC